MDADRFDDALRAFAARASRRGVLGALGGSLFVALPTALTGTEVAAKKKRKKKKRKKPAALAAPPGCVPNCERRVCGDDGCGGSCGACAGGKTCQGGVCACPAGTTECGGGCVDTATDPRNCGGCGNRCQVNGTCVGGACTCGGRTCTIRGATCCPASNIFSCACIPADIGFNDPATCNTATPCPPERQCAGPECAACCPVGSTCDPDTGTCLQ